MPIDPQSIDVETMTPEEFIALVRASSDNEIRATFRAAGTAAGLDRIFGMMEHYYRPERAGAINAEVQWRITDDGENHDYVLRLTPTACAAARGTAAAPRTSVTVDLARFARIVSGQANPVKLLMTRKLKASGDVMFARKIDGFFDIPGT